MRGTGYVVRGGDAKGATVGKATGKPVRRRSGAPEEDKMWAVGYNWSTRAVS